AFAQGFGAAGDFARNDRVRTARCAVRLLKLKTVNLKLTCSFSALNEPFQNAAVRDAVSAKRLVRFPDIPRRTRPRSFHRRAMLRRRVSGVLRGNVRRRIRRARARPGTSARRTQGSR